MTLFWMDDALPARGYSFTFPGTLSNIRNSCAGCLIRISVRPTKARLPVKVQAAELPRFERNCRYVQSFLNPLSLAISSVISGTFQYGLLHLAHLTGRDSLFHECSHAGGYFLSVFRTGATKDGSSCPLMTRSSRSRTRLPRERRSCSASASIFARSDCGSRMLRTPS
jgi:hypothetical protein